MPRLVRSIMEKGNAASPNISEALKEAFATLTSDTKGKILTGLTELDRQTGGLHPGLHLIAGRPGMGVQSLLNTIALNVANSLNQQRERVMIVSPGMKAAERAARLLCAEARINRSLLLHGMCPPEEWNRLTDTAQHLISLNIHIEDFPRPTVASIAERLSQIQENSDARISLLVVTDPRMIVERSYAGNRDAGFLEVLFQLKALSRELDMPIVVGHGVSSFVDRTTRDKRPQMSSFEEPGVEAIPNSIWFLYRDDHYFYDSAYKGIAEIIVARQRGVPVGTARVKFDANSGRFDNLDAGYDFDDDYDPFAVPANDAESL